MTSSTPLSLMVQNDLIGASLIILDAVDSTNDELLRRLRDRSQAAAAAPLAVVSGEQTAGRGRLGRDWCSPAGGVYMSVLVDGSLDSGPGSGLASADSSAVPALSLLAALAVREALQSFTSQPIQIKWPNDVLCSQGKLAGILVERRTLSSGAVGQDGQAGQGGQGGQTGQTVMIVGIGINVLRPEVPGAGFEGAAYLEDYGQQISPRVVARAVLDSVFGRYRQWQAAGYSFAPFVAAYQEHQAQLGEQVWVRNAMGDVVGSGELRGVDSLGRLLLFGEQGAVFVSAGEVTLRNCR